ncbi:MAG: flagellar FliJ family protein [Syntrophomonadaceae bacterium]|jgi:flagellar FliJ protein|nr:flagellar FliJ family protein [Syntrophomonadaceae bacterium]
MKSFHFRLQTKLNLCKSQEQMAKEKLAVCVNELEKLKKEQAKILDRINALENTIRVFNQEHMLTQEVIMNKEYLPVLREKHQTLEDKIQKAALLVEEARRDLLEKKKASNMFEKLRDKKWREYSEAVKLEEQKKTDEVAMISYFRNKVN